MRRQIKKQTQKAMELLKRAERLMEQEAGTGDMAEEALKKLLEDTQSCALEIGNTIEAEAGEGTATVRLLEAYCEALFSAWAEEDREKRKRFLKDACALGERARESLEEEFEGIREIVFLPARRDMWKDMAPLWERFQKEEGCRCSLIPVPFWETAQDGAEEARYEGELFEGLPVLWYEDYPWEDRAADVILMQRPENGEGRRTRQDSRFGAERLRELGEILVEVTPDTAAGWTQREGGR